MSQQTIKQQARRTAREMAGQRRKERVIDLAERVMVAIGERDAAVAETEKCAGEALRELTQREGLSLGEAVEWCGGTVTVGEATRLRRLASKPQSDADLDRGGERDGSQAGGAAAVGTGGGVGIGSSAESRRVAAIAACVDPFVRREASADQSSRTPVGQRPDSASGARYLVRVVWDSRWVR
jgi:hypothetical protein